MTPQQSHSTITGGRKWWALLGLNQRPLPCEVSYLSKFRRNKPFFQRLSRQFLSRNPHKSSQRVTEQSHSQSHWQRKCQELAEAKTRLEKERLLEELRRMMREGVRMNTDNGCSAKQEQGATDAPSSYQDSSDELAG